MAHFATQLELTTSLVAVTSKTNLSNTKYTFVKTNLSNTHLSKQTCQKQTCQNKLVKFFLSKQTCQNMPRFGLAWVSSSILASSCGSGSAAALKSEEQTNTRSARIRIESSAVPTQLNKHRSSKSNARIIQQRACAITTSTKNRPRIRLCYGIPVPPLFVMEAFLLVERGTTRPSLSEEVWARLCWHVLVAARAFSILLRGLL